jgi:DNA-binding CsgD family transcriptional regulator
LAARIYTNSSSIEINRRANAAAREWLVASLRYCTEHDLKFWETYSKGLLAELIGREGDWVESERLARDALEAAVTPTMRFPASAALCRIQIRRGDNAADLLENLAFDSQPQRLMYYAPILGEHAWLSGDEVAAALEVLRHAGDVAAQIGNVWAAGEIEYWRARLEGRKPSAAISTAEPFALLFSGDWWAAADEWGEMNAPYERALALLEGTPVACDEALGILDRLGARATASRARHDLRARGLRGLKRGPRASTRSNPAGLTLREREVLVLLGAGNSNGEIAARLNTASKTVDHHVSAILSKLGASSRLEAVAKARQLGLFEN